jgi:hypothetical protein
MSAVMEKEIFRLRRLLRDTIEQRDTLAKFVERGIEQAFDGMAWDGADIQETAEGLGLLIRETYDPERHNPELGCIMEPGDTLCSPVLWLKHAMNGKA